MFGFGNLVLKTKWKFSQNKALCSVPKCSVVLMNQVWSSVRASVCHISIVTAWHLQVNMQVDIVSDYPSDLSLMADPASSCDIFLPAMESWNPKFLFVVSFLFFFKKAGENQSRDVSVTSLIGVQGMNCSQCFTKETRMKSLSSCSMNVTPGDR